ncbi:MAG: LamG domain-containing protein [Bacteroidetes bacterium]|nr:LamG domain-containing protein [Bacteroidota bacterium]
MKRYILSTCQKVIFLFAFVLTFGATAYAQPGAALKFDGVDDIVTLPPLFVGASDFSVEFWMNYNTALPNQRLFNFSDGGTVFMRFTPSNSNGNPSFEIANGAAPLVLEGSNNLPTGIWTHIAITAGAGQYILYINGAPASSGTSSIVPSILGATTINYLGHNGTADPFYNGSIDEFRVWYRTLCQQEVQTNRTCEYGFSGLPGLHTYYRFNQGVGGGNNSVFTTLQDESINNLNGNLVNFSLNGTNSNWIAGGGVTTGLFCAATSFTKYFADTDGDLHGNISQFIFISTLCTPPSGFVNDSTDCNDTNPSVFSTQLFYVDADQDGFGAGAPIALCESSAPAGYSLFNTDCNDANPLINPNTFWYVDGDNDGFGDPIQSPVQSCTLVVGYASNNNDCDDSNPLVTSFFPFTLSSSNSIACIGDIVNFSASIPVSSYTQFWKDPLGVILPPGFLPSHAHTQIVSAGQSGYYSFTISSSLCTQKDSIQLTVNTVGCVGSYYPPPPGGKTTDLIGAELFALYNNQAQINPDSVGFIYNIQTDSVYIEVIAKNGQTDSLLTYFKLKTMALQMFIRMENMILF